MNSKKQTLCICSCDRKPMDKIHFDIYNKNKHCEKCGKKFKLIPAPIIGVWVQAEGANCEDWEWISIEKLKQLLKL